MASLRRVLYGRADDLANGRKLGRYRVVSHLAKGAMADLYVARQEAVGGFEKKLVIKALQARHARDPRLVRMFLDEARLAAKLNHPSIVHVYDVAQSKGKKFIAMEYIQGGTLTDIIKRGVEAGRFLPIEHALHIVGQVAAGLDYAHHHRDPRGEDLPIIHGEVSLSSIMVTNEGQAKLIAFGNALVRAQIPPESQLPPAKARYLSPERLAGEATDHRSDIYSLGVVLYETTVAQPIRRGPTEDILKWIRSEPIRPPTSVRRDYPPALESIVMKALEKRPADRYQSADQLRGDLEDFVAAAGLRSDPHLVALYLRDLFPTTGPFSGEGSAPPPPGAETAEASANEGGRDWSSAAFELVSHRRGPTAVRRAMFVAIPALTALAAFAFIGRPPARSHAPAALLSKGALGVSRQRQPVTPPEAAFASPSSHAQPPTIAVLETTPTAALQRVTIGSVPARAHRQRQRTVAAVVTSPAPFLAEARLASSSDVAASPVPDPTVMASPTPAGVDSKAVNTVVRAHANEVSACFDRALMELPDLHGRLSVRATIDAAGRVLEVSAIGAAMTGGGRLQECVMAAFRRWTFPPPPPGAERSISYSFRFE